MERIESPPPQAQESNATPENHVRQGCMRTQMAVITYQGAMTSGKDVGRARRSLINHTIVLLGALQELLAELQQDQRTEDSTHDRTARGGNG